jgi:serine/threonine-protein kinase SRPK3
MKEHEAAGLSEFLLPMLEWYPEKRATAKEILEHPWLNMESNYETHMEDKDF